MGQNAVSQRNWSMTVQTVVWVVIFLVTGIPFFYNSKAVSVAGISSWALTIGSWCLMYYLNYFWFIPRMLFKRKTARYILSVFLASIIIMVVVEGADYFLFNNDSALDVTIFLGVAAYFILFTIISFAAIAVRSIQRNKELEYEREKAHAEQADMELSRLKNQLNPHFLFNSLNNISALSAIDPEQTQLAIERLSSMLRYVLYDTAAPLVTLAEEAEFIHNYIALMSLRYTQKLQLEISDDFAANGERKVPPMLFISLIENAFKYGASSTHASQISIEAHCSEQRLCMSITNTLLTPAISAAPVKAEPRKHGVGLRNLRRRLEILFPNNHTLRYGPTAGGLYEAVIEIPLS